MRTTAANDGFAIGVDLGGTNLRGAAYEGLGSARAALARRLASHRGRPAGGAGHGPSNGASNGAGDPGEIRAPEPVARRSEPVGEPRDPARVAERLAALIGALAGDRAGPIPVGVGFAGMLRGPDAHVVNSPHMRWRDVPLGAMLRERLGPRFQLSVENDASAITYGEHALGAGAGAADVLGVFVGTGIGGGVVAGGQLIRGASGAAGEIGHFKVAYGDDAPPCACGRRGCAEAFVGGSYLQRRARAELARHPESAVVRLAGSAAAVHPGHIDAAAAEGDDWALDLYAEIAPLLAVALANAVTLLNPARLVLGGGVLSRTPVLREHVIAAFQLAVTDAALEALTIADAALGDDAGLVGGALLALERAAERASAAVAHRAPADPGQGERRGEPA